MRLRIVETPSLLAIDVRYMIFYGVEFINIYRSKEEATQDLNKIKQLVVSSSSLVKLVKKKNRYAELLRCIVK
jgi:hypothetical protein